MADVFIICYTLGFMIKAEGHAMAIPDRHGRFGPYGGRYVPETLMPALLELEEMYQRTRRDRTFQTEFKHYSTEYGTADAAVLLRSV